MVMEEVNEDFREGQDEEAKINIVVGMPKIDSVTPQILDETPPVLQDQIPVDPPQHSAPQPDVLHSGRISLRKGIEQKVVDDSVNNSLSPIKTRNVKETDVYERLYSDHEEKLIQENLLKSAANNEFPGSPIIKTKKVIATVSSPKAPRVYSLGPELTQRRMQAIENFYEERRKESHPVINEVSRQLAERFEPTADRKAFKGVTIIPPPRKDLSLTERSELEIKKKKYTFHPTTTPLDPSILAPQSPSGSSSSPSSSKSTPLSSTSASASSASSSISTPNSKNNLHAADSTSASGTSPGGSASGRSCSVPVAGGGEGGEEDALSKTARFRFEQLRAKGEETRKRLEEKRRRRDEEVLQPRVPQIDHNSEQLIPKGSTFMKRYTEWVHTHIPPPALSLRLSTSSSATPQQNSPTNAAGGGAGATIPGVEEGSGSPNGGDGSRSSRASTIKGTGGVWSGGGTTSGGSAGFSGIQSPRSKERDTWRSGIPVHDKEEDVKACTFRPQIIDVPTRPTEDLEQWMEKTYGVKKYLERVESARKSKEERRLFNPNRKYPPPPTKIQPFNLTKTKKELQKDEEEEVEESVE